MHFRHLHRQIVSRLQERPALTLCRLKNRGNKLCVWDGDPYEGTTILFDARVCGWILARIAIRVPFDFKSEHGSRRMRVTERIAVCC